MLKDACLGRPGEADTVWGMVHVACSELKALRVKATNRKHRLEVVEPRVVELEGELKRIEDMLSTKLEEAQTEEAGLSEQLVAAKAEEADLRRRIAEVEQRNEGQSDG